MVAKDKLSPKQEKALDLIIKYYKSNGKGMTIEEIAEAVGVSRQTVSTWMNHNELFREEYDRRIRELNKYATAYAMNTMIELLECNHVPTRLGAAKDLLDRAGFKPAESLNLHTDADPVVIVDDMGG